MTDYKLVPVEPTIDMTEAGSHPDIVLRGMDYDRAQKCWRAMLAAAPDVQGESVAWQFFQDGKWYMGGYTKNHRENTVAAGFPVRDLYAAHQPAEHQPALDVADYEQVLADKRRLTRELDVAVVLERIDRELRPRSMCRDCADGDGRCDSGELCCPHQRADELMGLLRASLAAPDVSGLEDLLEDCKDAVEFAVGHSPRLGDQVMYEKLLERIDTALSAHRKQGGAQQ